MRKSQVSWMVVAAALLSAAAWHFGAGSNGAPAPASPGQAHVPVSAVAEEGRTAQTQDKVVEATQSMRGLYDGLYAAGNLKTYYEEMKTRPAEGGYFYALSAITSCRQKMYAIKISDARFSSDKEIFEKQKKAQQALKELCGDFTEDDIRFSYRKLHEEGDSLGDPLLLVQSEIINASTREELYKAIVNLFGKNDAYLAATLWPYFGRLGQFDGEKGKAFFFDGENYSLGNDFMVYQVAWQLVPCINGARCDPQSDTFLMIACIEQGICVDTREQFIADRSKSDQMLYKKAFALAQRLSDAVWQGNYKAFLPRP